MRPGITLAVLLALAGSLLLPGQTKEPEERIAFQRNDPPSVTVMFMDGSDVSDLAPNRKFSPPYITPALAPNGNTIVFAAMSGGQFKLFTWRLDEHNATVGDPKRLTPETSEAAERYPAWSPDGRQLAFLATDKANKTTLCVIDADGGNPQPLTAATFTGTPSWSPDGRQLLYTDLIAGRPVLHNIPATGGKGLPFRPDSRIISACYASNGKQIAALIEQENGMTDLYIVPPFGIGGRVILRNIVGAKHLCWRKDDTIIFTAAKVGNQGGKAIWLVGPDGNTLHGVTGYADPKQVSYFSVQRCDLTPYVPVAVLPNTPAGQPAPALPPPDAPADEREPDLTSHLALHALTIVSPLTGAAVQGKTPVTLVTRKNVAAISILVNGQFACSMTVEAGTDAVAKSTFLWDTQALNRVDPLAGFHARYADQLKYPDGTYTICAQALDTGKNVIDQHTITVSLRNELPTGTLPGDTAALQYRYSKQEPIEYYRVHGEGEMIGAGGAAQELNATLDAAFRRILQRPLTNGRYPFRTEVCGPPDRPAMKFGELQATQLPEFVNHGMYGLDPQGGLTPETTEKILVPLAQLAVPVPETPVKVGEVWEKPMWVVADLFDREASQVNARHVVEGMEWVGTRRAVRVRSDFRLDSELMLHTLPTSYNPGLRGSRDAALRDAPVATGNSKLPAIKTVEIWKAVGVRYAWFDLEAQRLLKVDDRILYTILKQKLPPVTGPATTEPPNKGIAAWYLVHYQYDQYTPPSTRPKK